MALGKKLRDTFDISDDLSDEDALRVLKNLANRVCKPCWELSTVPTAPWLKTFHFFP
jgi:hypothetical protein